MTIHETVAKFVTRFNVNKRDSESFADFCCVVVSDLTPYSSISSILAVTRCDTMETANVLLEELSSKGFYTVDTSANSQSNKDLIYVFMCRKADYNRLKNEK